MIQLRRKGSIPTIDRNETEYLDKIPIIHLYLKRKDKIPSRNSHRSHHLPIEVNYRSSLFGYDIKEMNAYEIPF